MCGWGSISTMKSTPRWNILNTLAMMQLTLGGLCRLAQFVVYNGWVRCGERGMAAGDNFASAEWPLASRWCMTVLKVQSKSMEATS